MAKTPGTTDAPGAGDWQRSDPDSAIYLPTGERDLCNQQIVGIVTRAGSYIVAWTMASKEAEPDQRVVVSRSVDRGATWGEPVVLGGHREADPGAASYGVLYEVPETGRIYLFYLKADPSYEPVRKDISGFLAWQYSDDDGVTWQRAASRFNMGRGAWTEDDASMPGNWIGIYSPHETSRGDVLFSFARYGLAAGGNAYGYWMTEVYFLRLDNVKSEADAEKLRFTVLPRTPRGLRIERDNGMYWGNEPSWIELSDGRLVTAIRTRNDAVYYAVSRDFGETWSTPEPLLYRDDGQAVRNPSAPCPMIRLSDGRIVLMFYNQKQDSTFGPRNPVYLAVGRETRDARQPIAFGPPVKFMAVDGPPPTGTTYTQIASYSTLVEHDGEVLLFYNDGKHWVLFKRVPPALLRWRGP